MKKTSIILILLISLISCKKEDSIISNSSKNKTKNEAYNLKTCLGQISSEELTDLIQTFQSNRRNYWENSTTTDYTQNQAITHMSIVMNYELAGYGYFSEFETTDFEIIFNNKELNEAGETVLDCGSFFERYKDIEDYIKTQLGEKKLYAADFTIKETTVETTNINVHLLFGAFTTELGNNTYTSEFPAIPINIYPSGGITGNVIQLADWFTQVFNPIPNNPEYVYREAGKVLIKTTYDAAAYGYYNWVLASNSWDDHSSSTYKLNYYNFINTRRLARYPDEFATSIPITYYHNISTGYTYQHIIYVNFAYWKYDASLFINGSPIIQ